MADGRSKTGIEDRLLDFIRKELVPPKTAVEPGDDLLSGGLLDSMSVLRLATFVGEEFDLEIAPADFVVENFRSVEALAGYVRRTSTRSHETP